ncbi:hypothetical protein ACVIIW_006860 [Bradyrhizobium sp. USDA 4449]
MLKLIAICTCLGALVFLLALVWPTMLALRSELAQNRSA